MMDIITLLDYGLVAFIMIMMLVLLGIWMKIRGMLKDREDYDSEISELSRKLGDYDKKLNSLVEEANRTRGDLKKKHLKDEMEKIMIKV
jgi:uncharacterized coiled-coil DUF342 family protein